MGENVKFLGNGRKWKFLKMGEGGKTFRILDGFSPRIGESFSHTFPWNRRKLLSKRREECPPPPTPSPARAATVKHYQLIYLIVKIIMVDVKLIMEKWTSFLRAVFTWSFFFISFLSFLFMFFYFIYTAMYFSSFVVPVVILYWYYELFSFFKKSFSSLLIKVFFFYGIGCYNMTSIWCYLIVNLSLLSFPFLFFSSLSLFSSYILQ
jgi:hypothetical protein